MHNMEKVNEQINSKFIILGDFYDSFSRLPFHIEIDKNLIRSKIIVPFREKLKYLLPKLEIYDSNHIIQETTKCIDKRYYVITMDDGTYFTQYDYNFNITRTAYKLENIRKGPYFRVPRDEGRDIITQAQHLHDNYIANGNQKSIVLCDDGIGTGKSLEKILSILNELRIEVNKIYVLLNPNKTISIRNKDIETIFGFDEDFAWLSERDLFWGLPRS